MPPVIPVTRERVPRRGRYLVPLATPRRAEVIAVCAIVALLAGALFAQVTLVAAALFHAFSKASRLRPWWLLVPMAAGLVWLLAGSPATAAARFGAAPAAVTALLRESFTSPAALRHLARLPGVVAPRLTGQLPVALMTGAALAAVGWWLDWLRTDEWDLAPARPGVFSVARRSWHLWSIRSGGVVTRDGVSLGVDAATGRPAELTWRQARSGVLVTGADPDVVTTSGLQVMYAALRRRQPVVVVDLSGGPAFHRAVAALCAACDAPLQVAGPHQAATSISVEEVVWRRGAALFLLAAGGLPTVASGHEPAATGREWGATGHEWAATGHEWAATGHEPAATGHEPAVNAVADLVTNEVAAAYTGPRGALAPAGLVWVNGCEAASPAAVAALATAGQQGPLAWLLSTTEAGTAAAMAARAGVCVVHRVADPGLAGQVARLAGTRLVPAGHVTPGWVDPQADAAGRGAVPLGVGPVGVVPPGVRASRAEGYGMALVPAVPAETFGTLGEREFFLVAHGHAVRARAVRGWAR